MATRETSGLGDGCPDPPASSNTKIFRESNFFKERRASALPSPSQIRALNVESGNVRATDFNRPSPVIIPSLGLFVKYGADVTVVEAQTQMRMRKLLESRVPIPEVFGWAEDGEQRFIYMSLVEGDSLQARWAKMNEDERQAVCRELKSMVNTWRALSQNELEGDRYVGSMGKHQLNDIFFRFRSELQGPFAGPDAVQRFQDACDLDISGDIHTPIVFTHNDVCPPNILLSPGPNPKVVAIIDWNQSGWYPWYWESCKSRQVGLISESFDRALLDEWHTTYVPMILDPADDEAYYHPFIYFVLSKGI